MPIFPGLGAPMTPRIGVTGLTRAVSGADRSGVNSAYVRSVLRAGGIPLILSPLLGPELAGHVVETVDGLLLTGGDDMDPSHYGEAPHPSLDPIDPQRDAFELAVFRAARDRQVPTLAICRGFQLVNVALGGTLWQDLPSQRPAEIDHRQKGARNDRSHRVEVVPQTMLAEALRTTQLEVNSFHHQGIRKLAPGLKVSALSPDGLAEGLEQDAGPAWLLAVQWHPEEFHAEAESPDLGLFQALVREANRASTAARQDQWR